MRSFQDVIWKSSDKFAYPKPRESAIVLACRVTKCGISHSFVFVAHPISKQKTQRQHPHLHVGLSPQTSKIVHITHEIIITGIPPLVLCMIPVVSKIIVIIIVVIIILLLFFF